MAFLNNQTSLLKSTGTMALWGLGIYVGLRVVLPVVTELVKPLAMQAGRGLSGLRNRMKGVDEGADEEMMSSDAEEQSTAATRKILVTEVLPVTSYSYSEGQPIEAEETASPQVVKAKSRPQSSSVQSKSAGKPMEKWTRTDLYAKAKELKIAGRSAMDRNQLIAALTGAMAT